MVLCLTTLNLKADSENCPTSVIYNSSVKQFIFYYASGIPKDGNGNSNYDRIQIENSIGQGSQWYTKGGVKIKILFKTDTTLTTNNASDSLDGTSEMYTSGKHKDKITYWQGGVDLRHDYSSSDKRFINHCYYDAPLPVKLINFNYEKFTSTFRWTTATEINNNCFVLQSSDNTKIWEDESVIVSKGINGLSCSILNYSYKIVPTKSYWRLMQYDYNGNYDSSDIIHINLYTTFPKIINNSVILTSGSLIINNTGQLLYDGEGVYELLAGEYFIYINDEWFKILIR